MGYACPVCGDPQADGEHLANHLAFVAMLHGDEHADFLDARVPDWGERTPGELSAELIHHADEVEYNAVFEDTTAGAGAGRSGPPPGAGSPQPGRPDLGDRPTAVEGLDDETLDAEAERAIEEARKLFERGGGDADGAPDDTGASDDVEGGDDEEADDVEGSDAAGGDGGGEA